jgi:hypothetical protein
MKIEINGYIHGQREPKALVSPLGVFLPTYGDKVAFIGKGSQKVVLSRFSWETLKKDEGLGHLYENDSITITL